MALVLMLGMLVLVTIAVLAFMTGVRTDLTASVQYDNQIKARMLGDSAVDLVTGQLSQATQRPDRAWISQPGLVRTFKAGGVLDTAYKLYSSDVMAVAGTFDPAADLPPPDWSANPNLWVDLNAPTTFRGEPVFPIVDAKAIDRATGRMADIEGFEVTDLTRLEQDAAQPAKLEMPVRWLYMLEDGTVATAVAAAGTGEVTVAGATAQNPVVARIAFWTDDETAKVNLNTASEGTYWDVPRAATVPATGLPAAGDWSPVTNTNVANASEYQLAMLMPSINEFQRYAGHPATTALSPIFGRGIMERLGLGAATRMRDLTWEQRSTVLDELYQMLPRTAAGQSTLSDSTSLPTTSEGATVALDSRRKKIGSGSNAKWEYSVADIPPTRKYATFDEFLYQPGLVADAGGQQTREMNELDSNAAEIRTRLERTRFFATTSSRSPETTLYNTPRVALWPMPAAKTPYERLVEICATVGAGGTPAKFFFKRQSAPTNPDGDYSDPQNQAILGYLGRMMEKAAPGFEGTFAQKYGAGSQYRQILLQMYDFLRAGVNLVSVSSDDIPYTKGSVPFTPLNVPGQGQVNPTVGAGGLRGFGRMPTISEMSFVLIGAKIEPSFQPDPRPNQKPPDDSTAVATYEVAFIPEMFDPMLGYASTSVDLQVEITGLRSATIDGQQVFPADKVTYFRQGTMSLPYSSDSYGGSYGPAGMMQQAFARLNPTASHVNDVFPTMVGSFQRTVNLIPYTGNGPYLSLPNYTYPATFQFGGARLTAKISRRSDPTKVIQTINFDFPPAAVAGPTFGRRKVADLWSHRTDSFDDRIWGVTPQHNLSGFIRNGDDPHGNTDTVRSLIPTGRGVMGDVRIIASLADVDIAYFQPTESYQDSSAAKRHLHTLVANKSESSYGTFGNLVQGVPRAGGGATKYELLADVPAGVDGVRLTDKAGASVQGDWDEGSGIGQPGAYLNKPDEGAAPDPGAAEIPYLLRSAKDAITVEIIGPSVFSPNRQVPSAGIFGSLPTGTRTDRPWQTLLFRPARTHFPGGERHPGSGNPGRAGDAEPADHLLMDLFWMPVVEPYAISEPFSTDGKINLNTQVFPFTYLRRETGLHALLEAEMLGAMPSNISDSTTRSFLGAYKDRVKSDELPNKGISLRRFVDVDSTIALMRERDRPFISASEICDVDLVPDGIGLAAGATPAEIRTALKTFWDNHQMTGDNLLERPYATIYPRVTTRSNTYTVHVTAQTLGRVPGGDPTLVDSRVRVTGEFRGSFMVERYLDPNFQSFNMSDPNAVLGPYRFRVLNSKQFAL